MRNRPLLLLGCLVVLMMISSQPVSAQVLGEANFRGSGSINPQAVSPTRALADIYPDLAFRAGEKVAEYGGTVAGICVGVILFLVCFYFKCKQDMAAQGREREARERHLSRIITA